MTELMLLRPHPKNLFQQTANALREGTGRVLGTAVSINSAAIEGRPDGTVKVVYLQPIFVFLTCL
jgi:hypothetical protein